MREMPEVPGASGPDEVPEESCRRCDGSGGVLCATCRGEHAAEAQAVEDIIEGLTLGLRDAHQARWGDADRLPLELAYVEKMLRRAATHFGVAP
jgi:hypothetical protein